MKNLKNYKVLWMVLGILGVLALVSSGIFTSLPTFLVIDSNLFVIPQWGRLECSAEDITTKSGTFTMSKDYESPSNLVTCGQDELVDKCDIRLDTTTPRWWSSTVYVTYQDCNLQGTSCLAQAVEIPYSEGNVDELIKTISSGRSLKILCEAGSFRNNIECDIRKEYKLFKLFAHDGGAKRTVNPSSCQIPSGETGRITQGETSSNGGSCLVNLLKGEWCNYIYDWAYGPGAGVANHPQYGEVYCSAGSIYSINKLTMKDGRIIKLEPESTTVNDDGESFKGLGARLSSVQCCPGTPNCGSDFKFKPTTGGGGCFSDAQCTNAGADFYYGSKQVVSESCVDSKCVLGTPRTVQCSTNADCGAGFTCSRDTALNPWSCVETSGDPDPDRNPLSCENKAEKFPWLGYEFVEERTESCGLNPLCHIGITNPKVVTESKCEATFLIYYIIAGVSIILGFLILRTKKINKMISRWSG